MPSRSGAIPRSFPPLAVLLALAVAWLLLDRGPDRTGRGAVGPLFSAPAESISAVDFARGGLRMRLERGAGGWELTGTVTDLVGDDAAADLVESLAAETVDGEVDASGGWRARAGEYGLDPEAASFLEIETAAGRRQRLTVGDANPATGLVYAAGCGREGVFSVSPALGERLDNLPNMLRMIDLWPDFHPLDVDTLTLSSAGGPVDVFARDPQGRWWLRMPADRYDRVGGNAADYHRVYRDRRREAGGRQWLRAADAKLANLLFFISEARIYEFDPVTADPPPPPAAVLEIGAAFSGGIPPQSVAIGRVVGEDKVEARRNGSPYGFIILKRLLDNGAVPLRDYVDATVLADPAGAADSLVFSRIDSQPIRMRRGESGWELVGDHPWSGTGPEPQELARDMLPRLQRLAIVRALPPTADDPLQRSFRTDVELCYGLPGFPPRVEVVFGVLADGSGAGAWFPGSGKLLEVDRSILTTMRSLFMVLGSPAR